MTDRLERDGKVAVIYSPGFGAGWYSWNTECGADAVFSPRLALAVLGESVESPVSVAAELFPGAYHGGVGSLRIKWVTKGERFEIHEYDGSESVRVFGPDDGFTA